MEDPRVWGWWQVVVCGIITAVVLSFTFQATRKRQFPPGPRGLPVLGSLLSLGTLPHQALDKLSKIYGPFMFMHLGSMPTLVVSNSQMAETILKTNDHVMASRPDLFVTRKLVYNVAGFSFAPYGPHWRYLRKISTHEILTTQRINRFQDMRQREVMEMLHSILETAEQGKAVNINEFLYNLTMNNVTQMMLSKSYCSGKRDSDSKEAITFREMIRDTVDLVGVFHIADYIPILKHFDLQGYNKRIEAAQKKMDTFLESVLTEHRKNALTGKQENFAEVLLAVTTGNEAGFDQRLSMDTVKAVLMEILVAGTDTAAATLEWALAELVKHPSTLQKAQEELDFVVGKLRLVNETDLLKLEYIQAIVKETLRLHPPLPLLLPHQSTEDCEIAGYYVPGGSRVLVNTWSIQRDPLVWENPLEFNPERFLGPSSTIDVKGNCFGLLPFGSGRRMCPGMNLGLLILQYPLAQMLHTISWTLPAGQKPEELNMSEGVGLACPKAIPLQVHANPRLAKHVIYPTKPM